MLLSLASLEDLESQSKIYKSGDLPAPLGPIRATVSPGEAVPVQPFSTDLAFIVFVSRTLQLMSFQLSSAAYGRSIPLMLATGAVVASI